MGKSKLFTLFSLLVFFTSSLFGRSEEAMQIIASSIEQNGTLITAKQNVLIFSPSYYITAEKVIYDRANGTMELFDNVNIIQDKHSQNNVAVSNYAFLNFKEEINTATPILLIDKKSNVWINAQRIEKKKNLNKFKDAMISSCDCKNPTWSIGFSSGDYNIKEKWVNLYNNTLYVKGYPLWYLVPIYALYNPSVAIGHVAATMLILRSPYFGFSTDNRRRSGVLIPKIGYSSRGGYSYAQPFYYAPQDNFDMEYIPQISEHRGRGHEFRYRYADSLYSKLEISLGAFYENTKYFEKYNLLNKKHYGYDIKYNRNKLFSKAENSDGIYLYLQKMNDIEYYNTRYDTTSTITDRLLKSEVKYFYNTQNFNTNIEFEQYDDISKNNNDDVMQVTPSLQFHSYSKEYFDLISSSLDFKYSREHRKTGLGANSIDIQIPFSYSKYIFKKYILFTYEKQFEFNHIKYTNNHNNLYTNGSLLKSKDVVSLELDMMKPYNSFLHTINFRTSYEVPKSISINGDFYGINNNDNNLSIFPYTDDIETLEFAINQSFYGKESLSTLVNHKVKQTVIFDDGGKSSFDNLENEITFYLPYTTLSNNLLYNHEDKMVINSSFALKLKKDNFFTNVDYSYSVDKNSITNSYKNGEESKSITGHIGNKVLKYYTVSYKEQHDIINNISNLKEYVLNIDKRCWTLDLKFSDSLVASATTTNQAIRQDILYATITLKPLASVNVKHTFDEKEE